MTRTAIRDVAHHILLGIALDGGNSPSTGGKEGIVPTPPLPVVRRPATRRRARHLSGRSLAALLAVLLPALVAPSPAAGGEPLRDRVRFGAWVGGMTGDPSRLEDFERLVRHRTDVASYYWGFGDVFPGAVERTFADGGKRAVLVSWDMGPTRFTEWSSGDHDAYLDQVADAFLAHPHRVHVRPWPEMNGDWQTFQPTPPGTPRKPHGGTYDEFVAAWRHVVDHFRDRGVDNVRWVFSPSADTYRETTPVDRIWPGRGYVDVLGVDGFNWGADRDWGTWRSFRDVFRAQYRRLVDLHPTAPVWICEVSSKEPRYDDGAPADPDRSKGAWVRAMMATEGFSRVRALVWFHERKERDWRVSSSLSSLRAMRRALG